MSDRDTEPFVAAENDDGGPRYYVPKPVNRQRPKKRKGGDKAEYGWLDSMAVDGDPIEVDLTKSGETAPGKAYKIMAGRLHQAFHTRRDQAKKAGLTPPNFVLDYDKDQHRLWVWLVSEEV